MSVQSEITRLANAKTALATAIEGKGVTVPDGTKLDGMAALVEAISAGGGNIEVMTFTPAATGVSEFFSFDKVPFYIICVRQNFISGDDHKTDINEVPFCVSICYVYMQNGTQQGIVFYNKSSTYFSGGVSFYNNSLNNTIKPNGNIPVAFRWSDIVACKFAFYTADAGAKGLRVGETYQVIIVFREEETTA